jgi:hypothetical protein
MAKYSTTPGSSLYSIHSYSRQIYQTELIRRIIRRIIEKVLRIQVSIETRRRNIGI